MVASSRSVSTCGGLRPNARNLPHRVHVPPSVIRERWILTGACPMRRRHRRTVTVVQARLAPPPALAWPIPPMRDVDRVVLAGSAAAPRAPGQRPPPQILQRADLDLPVVYVEPPRVGVPASLTSGVGAPMPANLARVVPPRLPVPDSDQRRPVKTTPGHRPERRPARRAVPRKDPPAGVRGTLLIRAGQAVVM